MRTEFKVPVNSKTDEFVETDVPESEDEFSVPNENVISPTTIEVGKSLFISPDSKETDASAEDTPVEATEAPAEDTPVEAPKLGTELDKFRGFKAELAIAETIADMKFLENKAAATAEFARRNKIGLNEQNEWGKFRIQIEAKKGEWLNKNFPAGGDRKSRLNQSNLKKEGIKPNESSNARLVTDHPDLAKKVMNEIEKVGKFIITPNAVSTGIKKIIKKAANTEIKKTEESNSEPDVQQPKKRGRTSKANRIIDSEEVMAILRITQKEVAILEKKYNAANKIYEDFEATKWTDKNDISISDDYKQKFEDKAWELQNIAIGLENEIEDKYLNFAKRLLDGNIKYNN